MMLQKEKSNQLLEKEAKERVAAKAAEREAKERATAKEVEREERAREAKEAKEAMVEKEEREGGKEGREGKNPNQGPPRTTSSAVGSRQRLTLGGMLTLACSKGTPICVEN